MTSAALILGAIATTASCLLCLEIGGISIKDTLVFPSHARKEAVYQKHHDVISKIETVIRTSRDFTTAERRIKALPWPDKVLLISLARRDRSPAVTTSRSSNIPGTATSDSVYSKTTWTNLRTVIRDGSGYGSVYTADGPRDLHIVDKTHPTSGTDAVAFTIYLEQPTS